MTGRELVKALEVLSQARLVAMDCVEVAPFLDPSGNTARIGARAVIDVLAGRIVARAGRAAS
jgi:arginase family enzyme